MSSEGTVKYCEKPIKKWLRHISVVKVFHSGYTFSLSEPDFHVQ